MSSDSNGYTPKQYLEAGYRAEAHGDRERAHQYYAYVADAFPESPEGEAARGGLVRLGLPASDVAQHGSPVSAQQPGHAPGVKQQGGPAASATGGPAYESANAGNRLPNGADPAHGPGANASPPYWQTPPQQRTHGGPPGHQYVANQPAGGQMAGQMTGPTTGQPGGQPQRNYGAGQPAGQQPTAQQRIVLGELARLKLGPDNQPQPQNQPGAHQGFGSSATDLAHDHNERLPEVVARRQRELAEGEEDEPPARRFRSGRFLAWCMVIVGWIAIAGGIAGIAIGFILPVGGSVMGFSLGVIAGVGGFVSGFVLVLLGQLALAVFDNTEAVRELAWLVRVRSGF